MMNNELINADNGMAINKVVTREAKEVEGMVYMAKKYPRDMLKATENIKRMCSRKSLAETSQYTYPRGGQKVSGPSIRLAEAIAQCWGNIDYSIVELSNSNGVSEMMAYAWDLETNVRRSQIFSVKHERSTKKGVFELTDGRDIYELTANLGARRVRACILGIIPQDIVDEALAICNKTLLEGEDKFSESLKNMLSKFNDELKITREQIERYIGYKVVNFDKSNLIHLKGIYDSIKDGIAKREDYFEMKAEAIDPLNVNTLWKPSDIESPDYIKPEPKLVIYKKDDDVAPFLKEDANEKN